MFHPTKLGQNLAFNYKSYVLALIIFVLGFFPSLISTYYLPYLFNPFSQIIRSITGKIHFAIGEWLYLIICILLIFKLIKWVWFNYAHFMDIRYWSNQILIIFNLIVKYYIIFELIWGLNYQKESPAKDFNLVVPTSYSEAQMDSLSVKLIANLNTSRAKLNDNALKLLSFDTILAKTRVQYEQIRFTYPFLSYPMPAIKKAFFPLWGDLLGYTAFYHPITGEAIIRADLPVLTLPFTVSHEIAHQLGFASETEANFIAYVIGTESKDPLFNYATELQLFTYAQLAELNSIAKTGDYKKFEKIIVRNKNLLSPQVLADRKQIRDFFLRKQELQIKGSAKLYDQFLLLNKQSKGIESYNDVLRWALAYKQKNP